jgi:two-component system, cell cycle response regulator DivK
MKSVLLVEDDAQSREVIQDMFTFENMPGDLVCVDRGEDALTILRTLDPSLILMDMRLPGMNGKETVKAIKSNPATRSIPIWAITALRGGADVDAALACGCSGYFVKPVDIKKVAKEVRAIQSGNDNEPSLQGTRSPS